MGKGAFYAELKQTAELRRVYTLHGKNRFKFFGILNVKDIEIVLNCSLNILWGWVCKIDVSIVERRCPKTSSQEIFTVYFLRDYVIKHRLPLTIHIVSICILELGLEHAKHDFIDLFNDAGQCSHTGCTVKIHFIV